LLPEKPVPVRTKLCPTETGFGETVERFMMPVPVLPVPLEPVVTVCAAELGWLPCEACWAEYDASFSPAGVLTNVNVESILFTIV
jgi:hypothetical protein